MIRKVIAAVAMIMGSIATLATVAAFFGGFWWGLDLLANYRWQAMWVAVVAAVVYALTGKGLFTAVFIVVAAINLWLILPSWVGSQPEATGEGGIRIVHVDLSGALDDIPSIEAWLLDADADVVFLAGITTGQAAPLMIEHTHYTLLSDPGNQQGVAIFGRDNWQLDTTFSADGQPVHLVSVPSEAGVIDVVTGWGNMSTSESSSNSLWHRFRHLTDVVEDANNPVVVIGNLGATRWSAASRHLLTHSTLRDATEGSGYLPTSPISDLPVVGRWIGIPIDVAYMSPEVTPFNLVVGPDIGAEHLPLTIDISPASEDR
jgi:hypothetical protein